MEGLIRKIIIGRDPKDAMAYYVGMRAGDGKVSAIVMDEEHLYRYQKKDISYIYNQKMDKCCGSL